MKLKQILKNRKGFTLMELIIVMVIIALLAAALLPSFLNFVRLAGERSLIAEARLGQVAAQVVMTETAGNPTAQATARDQLTSSNPRSNVRFNALVNNDIGTGGTFSGIEINLLGRVTRLTYERDGRTVTINDQGVVEAPAGG